MSKLAKIGISVVVLFIIGLAITLQFAHKLENQNLAIVQSMTGEVEVRRTPGWWIQVSPTIWEYPKAGMYQLNANDKDSLEIQFNNKSKATMNVAIGYRIDGASNEVLIALHQQVEGSDDKIWRMVLTCLNTCAQAITTKYDPSSVIGGEKFEVMVKEVYLAVMHNPELLKHGIDINYFAVDGRPIPDKDTEAQFSKQREADLAKRLAEADKVRLEAETLKTQAQYEKEIAEQRGQAEALMAKEVQAAEKELELAKIAKKQAEVKAEQEAEVAKIEANKALAVAEIEKQEEAIRLEKVKIVAQQTIETAKAKKESIALAGEITEEEQVKLEIEMKTKIGVAEQQAKTYAHWNPQVIQVSGNGGVGSTTSSLDGFLNMKAAEAAIEMTKEKK